MLENVIELNPRKRAFTVEEANRLLPVIRKITEDYAEKVQALVMRFEARRARGDASLEEVESDINALVEVWQGKLEKLGARPKGLWLADFDSGDGYFCWKYPEETITHWHKYDDGFQGRISLLERIELLDGEKDPDLDL